jgi:ParB-like chromosome segregation protein Spo0J
MTTPYEAAFPPLSEDEYDALVASIEEHGLIVPVLVDAQGRIIDGHQRTNACSVLGITPDTVTLDLTGKTDKERLSVAIIANLRRRQLTVAERKEKAKQLLDLGNPQRVVAAETGLPKSTVARIGKESSTGLPQTGQTGKAPNAKHSEATLADVKARLAAGETQKAIEAATGVPQTTISDIKKQMTASVTAPAAPVTTPTKVSAIPAIEGPVPTAYAQSSEDVLRASKAGKAALDLLQMRGDPRTWEHIVRAVMTKYESVWVKVANKNPSTDGYCPVCHKPGKDWDGTFWSLSPQPATCDDGHHFNYDPSTTRGI